ncbi:protease modulator HflC [Coralliovum pocilloporae]|uniref:protease modulator HflC n=1 Tax=Coralliovum pocilloporae TaxID=3066369 RepID=UPI003307156F
MKTGTLYGLGILVAAFAVLAFASLFVVYPYQQVLVLQFGDIKRSITEPGLNVKIPFIQQAVPIDKRILNLDTPPQEVIASDQKRLVVDAFSRYQIVDPVKFYQTVNNIPQGEVRLSTFLNSVLRAEIGKDSFIAVVRDKREEVMERILVQMDVQARDIGIQIVDVRIRRADLPVQNQNAVFSRMQTERQRQATELRAQGEEAARRITSRADRQVTVLLAEAKRDSEIIRGDGDAESNRIFANAYSQDADFFEFYRSMQAYREALQKNDTTLVLTPDSDFFRFFRESGGAVPSSAAQ